jgi:sugar phosphate isomerase/epimerase
MLAGLAVSNIAWPHQDFPRALGLARELGLQGVEIAPFNVFGRWDVADEDVRELRSQIEGEGLVCPSLQGILFNVPDALLFASEESRAAMAVHLQKVARMAGLLGASACVFGAPRQRDPGTLAREEAWEIAVGFLRRMAPVFSDEGTALAFEANAAIYGCRFVTTTAEAVDLVRAVGTPGIALQIDMGTIFLEGEDPAVLHRAAPLAAHAHISEPHLRPVGSEQLDHGPTAAALKQSDYSGFISIEMRATEDWESAVRNAVALLEREYA